MMHIQASALVLVFNVIHFHRIRISLISQLHSMDNDRYTIVHVPDVHIPDVPSCSDVVYMLQRQSYTYNGSATVLECSSCASGYHCVDLFVFYMQMITITRQVLCKDICTLQSVVSSLQSQSMVLRQMPLIVLRLQSPIYNSYSLYRIAYIYNDIYSRLQAYISFCVSSSICTRAQK